MSYTEKPVRPSDFQGGAPRTSPRTLRRMWGLDNEEEEDPFRDDGRWMRGWMEELKEQEGAKKGRGRSERRG